MKSELAKVDRVCISESLISWSVSVTSYWPGTNNCQLPLVGLCGMYKKFMEFVHYQIVNLIKYDVFMPFELV